MRQPISPSPFVFPREASVTTDRVTPVDCDAPDQGAICLMDDRFSVSVDWRNHLQEDDSGMGASIGIDGSDQSALFWFFDEANIELVVKILDGRAINESFWAFFGALSDIEYWVTIRDRANGGSRTYHNPPGELCGQADIGAFVEPLDTASWPPGSSSGGSFGASSTSSADTRRRRTCQSTRRGSRNHWQLHRQRDHSFACRRTALRSKSSGTLLTDRLAEPGGPYRPSAHPKPASSGSSMTATSSFPSSCSTGAPSTTASGSSGADSPDVSYRIRVRDTATGTESLYANPAGTICGGSDVEAF